MKAVMHSGYTVAPPIIVFVHLRGDTVANIVQVL